jgi:hypothetical protein
MLTELLDDRPKLRSTEKALISGSLGLLASALTCTDIWNGSPTFKIRGHSVITRTSCACNTAVDTINNMDKKYLIFI